MSLKWCAFTGALMMAFVALTFYHEEVSQDPTGVVTRWWDGSTQSVEHKYSNGKLSDRTEYGDDGKTVITFREWDYAGVLTHSKLRQKNGTVEEKMFASDGTTVLFYKLWNGDEKTFQVERKFFPNGKVMTETIMTEDGLVPAEARRFDDKGNLVLERKILDNADQETSMFREGKLTTKSTFKANGDQWEELFYDDGAVKLRSKTIRLTGEKESEGFTASGALLFKLTGTLEESVREVYEGGKVKLRQYYKGWGMIKVDVLSLATGKVIKTVTISEESGTIDTVSQFRADGTLERVKYLKRGGNGEVVKTIEYDASGKTVVSEKDGGETEPFDQDLFLDELGLLSKNRGDKQ